MLFLLISVCIDVGLIRFTNQNLARNKRLFQTCDELKQAVKLKEKVNKMIITNGLVYFLSHVGEFVMAILIIAYGKVLGYSCEANISCPELIEIVKGFNFVSMSFQLFIYSDILIRIHARACKIL